MNDYQQKQRMEVRLRLIFGEAGYEALTDSEKAVAEKVVRWEEGVGGTVELFDRKKRCARVIWDVVREYMGDEADELLTPCRKRKYVEMRSIMFKLMYETSFVPKLRIAESLGFVKDHATVYVSMKRCEDLYDTDKQFRDTYKYISRQVRERLSANGVQS